MQPITPPRKQASSSSQSSRVPFTPKTPFIKQAKQQKAGNAISPVKLRSTLLTPNPTPRTRKRQLGDAINFNSSNTTITSSHRTLFPPTPSTVGSGRIKDFKSPIRKVEFSPIDKDVDLGFTPQTHSITKRRLNFEGAGVVKLDEPTTPTEKVITRDLASKWAEDIPDIEEDDEVFITKGKLTNPFVTGDGGSNEFTIKRPVKQLDEIEYVNKKGEKFTKKLTNEQAKVKPKNLLDDLKKSKKKINVYNDNDDN